MRNNDVLIPFGTVDPWHERRAVHRVHELVRDYGVKGFKFHPSMQAFEPNDRRFYPIYEAIAEAGVPALFHTGQTGIGAGLPGGHGIKLRYSDPMLLDDVAADFPELTIVMAHPAVPWVDAQIAIATHKANVYIDLSRLVAEVLPAAAGARRQPSAAHQGAVRHRLPVHRDGPLAPRLREPRHRPGGGAADLQGERAAGARGHFLARADAKVPTRREKGPFTSARGSRRRLRAAGRTLPFAQGVQQFAVGPDQVGGVARAEPGVAPGMQPNRGAGPGDRDDPGLGRQVDHPHAVQLAARLRRTRRRP